MPKIVDHDSRRREIAIAASRALKKFGLDNVTLAQIASESGSTTGMIQHYFPTKWDVILAALHLMHDRMEAKLSAVIKNGQFELHELLSEALPLDGDRTAEAAIWLSFWSSAINKPELLAASQQLHDDWRRIIRQCLTYCSKFEKEIDDADLEDTVSSIIVFLDGLSIKAITRPEEYDRTLVRRILKKYVTSNIYNTV